MHSTLFVYIYVYAKKMCVHGNMQMLTATFSGDSTASSEPLFGNVNGGHFVYENVTINVTYSNNSINVNVNETLINQIVKEYNLTLMSNLGVINVSNFDSLVWREILRRTSLSPAQVQEFADIWNQYYLKHENDTYLNVTQFLVYLYNSTNETNWNVYFNDTRSYVITVPVEYIPSNASTSPSSSCSNSSDQACVVDYGTAPLLNYSYASKLLQTVSQVSGSVPRWWALANATSEYLGSGQTPEGCIVLIIDSALEKEVGMSSLRGCKSIGRSWKNVPTLENNECYTMDTVVRGVGMEPKSSIGKDLLLYANLGGLEYSFGLDFAAMFLDTNASRALEKELIQRGMTQSCLTVNLGCTNTLNSSSTDSIKGLVWSLYDWDNTLYFEGDASTNDVCVQVYNDSYTLVIMDKYGNGFHHGDGCAYEVIWDQVSVSVDNEDLSYGYYEQEVIERPYASYGYSRVDLTNQSAQQLTQVFEVVFGPQFVSRYVQALYGGASGGTLSPNEEAALLGLFPQYNATEMVQELDNSTYNTSVELMIDWWIYFLGFGSPVTVQRSVESGDGKWSSVLGNVVVTDYKYFGQMITQLLNQVSLSLFCMFFFPSSFFFFFFASCFLLYKTTTLYV
ncbi:hypothetical protein RFI_10313 [Reticulomyxa filosa]|uniref:Uncharacterized protein n=1 Tax=Reticulomyxa filosa TaxID=46433 RepID=X6NN50_RETFI|nr:hypothetical protein RFI_10313 [Reticulomyxa filosa]|eukprot:ETO26822.1 hypothetical protein RFI_10313 [Reticulomyxa filosa]